MLSSEKNPEKTLMGQDPAQLGNTGSTLGTAPWAVVGQLGCKTQPGDLLLPPDGAQPHGHLLSEFLMTVRSGKEDSGILDNPHP